MGTLYVVSTPIGNLEDITLRAIRVLSEVDIIACEDTRKTGFLLKKVIVNLSVSPKLISYYEGNELKRIPQLIRFLKEGKDIALVSNAGTPLVSDPGYKLVRKSLEEDLKIEPVPGASAVLAALVVSGLPTDKFLFFGYLPKKQGKRRRLLDQLTTMLESITVTVIFFESPYRLPKTLNEIKEVFGDIEIVICRELTKVHEEIRREKIKQSIKHFEKTRPKGEFVLLFRR